MVRLVIDTDPGVDDAHAIMAAFAHPEAQIEALTTVAGNVSLERTTANVCIILDVLEQNVPVYAGCEGPLVGPVIDAGYFHGADGLGDSGYPPSPRQVADEHAVNALIRLANEAPGELTLVAIGPLTIRPVMPASSIASFRAVSSGVSPGSTMPLGKTQRPRPADVISRTSTCPSC